MPLNVTRSFFHLTVYDVFSRVLIEILVWENWLLKSVKTKRIQTVFKFDIFRFTVSVILILLLHSHNYNKSNILGMFYDDQRKKKKKKRYERHGTLIFCTHNVTLDITFFS